MHLRQRAINFFKHLGTKTEPLRKTERALSISKSSIHRLRIGQSRQIAATGHHFFETEEGLAWLHRLFIAVLLAFGIQSGVGSETIKQSPICFQVLTTMVKRLKNGHNGPLTDST